MIASTLPTELLSEIFSSLVSHQSDLLHVSLASRTFYEIAKPLLYYHIHITNKQQREQLETIKEEDKKLVRKVTIEGTRSFRRSDAQVCFEKCALGGEWIEDLFSGKLLDISTIEVLHVSGVYEDTKVNWKRRSFNIKPAYKLVELSVVDHNGGGYLWDRILRQKYLPELRRLGFVDVSKYCAPNEEKGYMDSSDSDSSGDFELGDVGTEYYELGPNVPYAELEVLVADIPRHFVASFPFNHYLAVCLPLLFQLEQSRLDRVLHLHLLAGRPSMQAKILDFISSGGFSPKYLSIRLTGHDEDRRHIKSCLDDLESQGVEVHCDENPRGGSLSVIPSSFIDHLEKRKEEEAAQSPKEK